MDSVVSPIIARESARPYFSYSPFYPAERAYTKMFAEIEPGEVLIPSPLLTFESEYILLHFQMEGGGALSSPQVPEGNMRDLAEAYYVKPAEIEAAEARMRDLQPALTGKTLIGALPGPIAAPLVAARLPGMARNKGGQKGIERQEALNVSEQQARGQAHKQQIETFQQKEQLPSPEGNIPQRSSQQQRTRVSFSVEEGVMQPLWIGERLLFARRVSVNGAEYLQGCWIDWPLLKKDLLEGINDLLPKAQLEQVRGEDGEDKGRLLATLPARLLPSAVTPLENGGLSTIELALLLAWLCMVLAAVAVAVLLVGAVSLSERRAAFVSAVTHELRTPLTTFKMYAEMLEAGMVKDDGTRKTYLATLNREADRLGHLVENVLAFARLERGRMGYHIETVPAGDLLDGVRERLAERAREARMDLVVEVGERHREVPVRADVSAVGQILFNLVDNACKYCTSAEDRRIHLGADIGGRFMEVRVRDHGPGIAGKEASRIFKPFLKSAREAAESAPGVGLGLALSCRLAREMGGELLLDESVTDGAAFVLRLPIARCPQGLH
jgi:signal transduction histidine kinase